MPAPGPGGCRETKVGSNAGLTCFRPGLNGRKVTDMNWTPSTTLAQAVVAAGFEYNPQFDIMQSRMDCWQRSVGYTYTYDVLAQPCFMTIDCEPFYFNYDEKRWLIELWKGQYGIMTGAEIGLYNSSNSAWNSAANASGSVAKRVVSGAAAALNDTVSDGCRFFHCVENHERLMMEFTLSSDSGQKGLFPRGPERHWWLTGFKWGMFTKDPSNLSMEVKIDLFPAQEMRDSFKDSVIQKGYSPDLIGTRGIKFTFGIAKTEQPKTRAVAPVYQKSNEWLVSIYKQCKKGLGIPNNDPNNFTMKDAAKAADLALDKVRESMPEKVDPVTAYHIILDLYEKAARAWHGSGH